MTWKLADRYEVEQLKAAVESSTTISEILRHLKIPHSGSAYAHITKRCDELGIDVSHLVGQGWAGGKVSSCKKSVEDILVMLPVGSRRSKVYQLRYAMRESGIDDACALCGIRQMWNGLSLVLEVDHVDGNWRNNLLENLRFLCPNCHSQQPTNKSWKNRRS